MALEQKLSLKLAQKLVMTPSLQQAIKLLQMTRLELEGELTRELVENPVLEENDEGDDASPEPLAEPEANSQTEENSKDSMDDIDLDAYFNDYLDVEQRGTTPSTYEQREAVPIENTLTREPDLYDHLLWQLHMAETSPRLREIAEIIIGNLDPDGFLAASIEEIQLLGASEEEVNTYRAAVEATQTDSAAGDTNDFAVSELSQNPVDASSLRMAPRPSSMSAPVSGLAQGSSMGHLGASAAAPYEPSALATEIETSEEPAPPPETPGYAHEEVLAALELVRSFDPPGIAWADLRESLLFQLQARGRSETLAYRIVDEAWDLCLKRQFATVSKRFGIPLAELEEPINEIRALETRPGRQYSNERTQYVEPDVVVAKVGDEYVIQLNDDGLPRLRVSRAYRRMLQEMRREGKQGEAQQYIKEKMRSAVWLIKSLDQRQRTIYKVANSIVHQQRGFLDRGIDHLRPMVLRDVAEDIGMHESTVSRVVSNKYIHTPRGLFPMKFFFHSGIDRDYGEDISSLTVKRKIKQMIEQEDEKRPLSDSELMRILNREGIKIARRTVAKYRDELAIPSSTDRKKIF